MKLSLQCQPASSAHQPTNSARLKEVLFFTVMSPLRELTMIDWHLSHILLSLFWYSITLSNEFIVIESFQVFCFTHWRSISVLSVVCVSQEIDLFPVETGNALQSGMLRFVEKAKGSLSGEYSRVLRSLKCTNFTQSSSRLSFGIVRLYFKYLPYVYSMHCKREWMNGWGNERMNKWINNKWAR